MRLELPHSALLLFWYGYLVVSYWFVSAPSAIGLAMFGWYGPRWLGPHRWVPFSASALLAIPLLLFAIFAVHDDIKSSNARAKLLRTLDRDEIVAGFSLYAGSKIWFQDAAHTAVQSVELPRPTNILGVSFTGTVWWNGGIKTWNGRLAADQSINGWPCRSDLVEIDGEGLLQSCELAAPHAFFGYELPAGTSVNYSSAISTWSLSVPNDKGLAIKTLSTTTPGGVTLLLTGDGRLKGISSGSEKTVVVRGVLLNTMNINVTDKAVLGRLAEPLVVAGERQPAGTAVRIDLEVGTVSLAGAKWWLSD